MMTFCAALNVRKFVWGLAAALSLSAPAFADLTIPGGGSFDLAGGTMDLGCTDVSVAGNLTLGAGTLINVRNFTVLAGGSVNAGSGQISLAGNWANSGSFAAGTSSVKFVDAPACAAASTISGNTSFYALSFVSTIGKIYSFAVGSTQRIAYLLTVTGTSATPIQLRSTSAGASANIDLVGLQSMNELAVNDLVATGVWLAPYLINRSTTSSTVRWFGEPDYARIPTLNSAMLALLMLLLGIATVFASGARRPSNPRSRPSPSKDFHV